MMMIKLNYFSDATSPRVWLEPTLINVDVQCSTNLAMTAIYYEYIPSAKVYVWYHLIVLSADLMLLLEVD